MKQSHIRQGWILLMLAGLTMFSACNKDNGSDLPEETQILNTWIWEGMNEVYLWEAHIPNLDPDVEPDPEAFFYKLL